MSAVNVLALLDAEIAFAIDEAAHFKIQAERADKLREARAAVAELIEASNRLASADAMDLAAAEKWWRAALARVQP